MCLLWQGFFFVFLVFAFWYLASSSTFPSDLIFLWQAGIGRLWSSVSSSSSACPVVDFVFGFLVRLSRSAFCFGFLLRLHRCLRLRLRLVSSFNEASRSPSSGFVSIMFAIKIALMLSSSWSSRHPFILFHACSSSCSTHPLHHLHHVCPWCDVPDRCVVDLCLWAQEI